jgi:hypothetical protein
MIYKVIYEKADIGFTGVILDVSEHNFDIIDVNQPVDKIAEIKNSLKYQGWYRKFTIECETVYVDTEFNYIEVYLNPKKYSNEHYMYVMSGMKEFIRNKNIDYILNE